MKTSPTKTHDKTLCQWLTSGRQSVVSSKISTKVICFDRFRKKNLDQGLFELAKKVQQCLLTLIQLLEKLPVLSETSTLDNNKQVDQQMIYAALKIAVSGLEKIITPEIKSSDNALTEPVMSATRFGIA